MAGEKRKDKSGSKEKRDKKEKRERKDKKRSSTAHVSNASSAQPSLLADEKTIDDKLSSLFAVKPNTKKSVSAREKPTKAADISNHDEELEELSDVEASQAETTPVAQDAATVTQKSKKRKRKDEGDDLEDKYMRKVARQTEKELEELKQDKTVVVPVGEEESDSEDAAEAVTMEVDEDDDEHYVPPKHETETGTSPDLEKANRTVFVGNIAVEAVTDKTARKELERHLKSFFAEVPQSKDKNSTPHKLETLRFRSTPFDPKLPKKAAFARGEVMTTTVQATNAYVIYSSPTLAREACRRLNATVVLDRHIRVDSVAHPAPVQHKRCVFVGNLGFVNDETNINAAKDEGREKKQKERKPADIEEGLWRTFAKHGTVESVRVVRDSKTRVGIGIAYVQFTDENAVEGALTEEGKAYPPMLPRKLRVSRARAMKRSKPGEKSRVPEKAEGYRRKITQGEATLNGRVGKLMGKAAAFKARGGAKTAGGIKPPEAFVFEGHRATSKDKQSGVKFNKKMKKSKPSGRVIKRTAAHKSGSLKKKSTKA